MTMIPCPASGFPAERGATVWTKALRWDRHAELTVREAARDYWCDGRVGNGLCQHEITRGSLHGATVGGAHYCACCVTAEQPQAQAGTGRTAA